ncbi:hypothetical protein ACFTSF_06765 [Kribbella sp. NPDC056951]|uniref:hypothetical protein n=1 Tax=Kribbella sp. NPDC056951 TaxID=3345978 RepID=UPI0036449C9C
MNFKADRISITKGWDRSTQIVASARTGHQLHHEIRYADGSATGFTLMPGALAARDVAIAGLGDGSVHVMASEYAEG